MPINRVCFARAAVCRRHGADSVGNSGQREEEESIVKFLLCARVRFHKEILIEPLKFVHLTRKPRQLVGFDSILSSESV